MLKAGDDNIFPDEDEHCCDVIDFILNHAQNQQRFLDASDLVKDKAAQRHDLGVKANYRFNPGDMVMLYDHRESGKKLRASWRDPFFVSGYGGDMGRSYTLRQINGKSIPGHYHGDSLKPFRLREGYIVTNKEAELPLFQNIRLGNAAFKLPIEQRNVLSS
ncbi:hypothetical protein K3495_g12596 [Podosphaera aphanis]|nr:hypothetical protein K3495_g12596 [Podosphaera aphanis]